MSYKYTDEKSGAIQEQGNLPEERAKILRNT